MNENNEAINLGKVAAEARKPFPFTREDSNRLKDYDYYEQLFMGHHFEAFKMKITDENFNRSYSKLRYVQVNFAGLLSKVCADMLFSEPITVRVPDGDQEFLEELIKENNLHIQWYESALQNSYYGDTVFKERIGKRHPNDTEMTLIIEENTPKVYFPHINPFNVRDLPLQQELAWKFKVGDKAYVRREIHEPGVIYNRVFAMDDDGFLGAEVGLGILNDPNILPVVETGIDRYILHHSPNWKVGSQWNGISDYHDVDSLFFAINNRLTKTDNVLDKHTDPILLVPPGVLDETGKPRKKDARVIEIGSSEDGKPEYVVWDASLENAFKQVDKIIESILMITEISPDVLGMGQGMNDSGRALKLKLMRTIAKVARKRLYYDKLIKESLYCAQLLAKEHNIQINGKRMTTDAVMPEIVWQDGLPIDEREQLENEQLAIDMGLTTVKESIMRVYKVDEEAAEEMAKTAKDEKHVELPTMQLGAENAFSQEAGNNNGKVPANQQTKKVPVAPKK